MLCSTMLIEIIQYFDKNERQAVYILFLDASKAFDRVCYTYVVSYFARQKICPRIVH